MHGNEYVGAIALTELLQRGITPKCGALSLIFLNLDAFARFCPANPILSRFVKEDMNRLWGDIATGSAAASPEQKRVRTLRPYIETVDCLLDLHSMLWPAKPLMLAGPSKKGLTLAERIATPPLIVTDNGHKAGARLIDMPHFVRSDTSAQACLLEAGQHWSVASLNITRKTVARFLTLQTGSKMQEQTLPKPEIAHVTHRVTARTGRFCFTRMFPSGEMIAKRGTIIATDGPDEIRTPYDNCLLVMPNFRVARHHTAVRLAQIEHGAEGIAGPERS